MNTGTTEGLAVQLFAVASNCNSFFRDSNI